VGEIHEAHPAPTEDALDLVVAERDVLEIREQLGFGRDRHRSAAAAAEAVACENVRPAGRAGSY